MKTSEKWTAGIGTIVLAVAASFSGITIASPPVSADIPVQLVELPASIDLQPEVTPAPALEPVAPEPVPEPAPVAEPVAPAPAPAPLVKCPSGTIPGQVDGAGNESNCQATNNGQPCVEYNDANECVAWYKP